MPQPRKRLYYHDSGAYNSPLAPLPYNTSVFPDGSKKSAAPYDQSTAHAFKDNPNSVSLGYAGPVGSNPTEAAFKTLHAENDKIRAMHPGIEGIGHGEAYKRWEERGDIPQPSVDGRETREASWRSRLSNGQPYSYGGSGAQKPEFDALADSMGPGTPTLPDDFDPMPDTGAMAVASRGMPLSRSAGRSPFAPTSPEPKATSPLPQMAMANTAPITKSPASRGASAVAAEPAQTPTQMFGSVLKSMGSAISPQKQAQAPFAKADPAIAPKQPLVTAGLMDSNTSTAIGTGLGGMNFGSLLGGAAGGGQDDAGAKMMKEQSAQAGKVAEADYAKKKQASQKATKGLLEMATQATGKRKKLYDEEAV